MRSFVIATATTLVLGFSALAVATASGSPSADKLQGSSATLAPANDVRAVEEGAFVSQDLAFDRLTLEVRLEEFYGELAAQAEGMSEAERRELYRTAEAELTRLILGSSTYSGPNVTLGHDYLQLARLVLAQRLGFQSIPV